MIVFNVQPRAGKEAPTRQLLENYTRDTNTLGAPQPGNNPIKIIGSYEYGLIFLLVEMQRDGLVKSFEVVSVG